MINRSHPPFLSKMVKDVYRLIQDDEWLKNAYNSRFLEDGQNYCAIDLNSLFSGIEENMSAFARI